jgi:ATP-binding cassette subfamily F protein 3
VLAAEGLDVSAGDKHLLSDVGLALERGEHVALVGPNGSGKTTLVELLLARPLGYGVVPAYFSQQEVSLDETKTVLGYTQAATGLERPKAQALLGRFLFSGWDEHEKPVAALSGGERRRLALAVVVASGANFLVLDEPTNHLDLESREALEEALMAFPGTVLLVSHDRALLDAVAGRTLALEDGTLRSYEGGWADYVRRREELARPDTSGGQAPGPVRKRQEKPKPAPPPRPRPRAELEQLEAEIAAKEEAVGALERRLAEDWADVDAVSAYRREREELERLLERWERLFEAAQA